MAENASATELTSQYTAQVTADLERNTKEQERVGAEIAALQEQLAALQRDRAVLDSIRKALDAAPAPVPSPAPAEPAAPSGSTAVPAPRRERAAKSGSAKRVRAKKTATAAESAPAGGKPAAKTAKTPKKRTGKAAAAPQAAQPTLVDLVRGHLAEQSEPRSAAEIATALGQAHPDRGVKTTVVRTTLEGLVAKNRAQRSKQGTSVFYTTPDEPHPAAPDQAAEPTAPAGD